MFFFIFYMYELNFFLYIYIYIYIYTCAYMTFVYLEKTGLMSDKESYASFGKMLSLLRKPQVNRKK